MIRWDFNSNIGIMWEDIYNLMSSLYTKILHKESSVINKLIKLFFLEQFLGTSILIESS